MNVNITIPCQAGQPPQITTVSLPNAYVGIPYSADLGATGTFTPLTWSGTNLGWMSVTPAGHISGTPTAEGTINPTFTLTDGNGP